MKFMKLKDIEVFDLIKSLILMLPENEIEKLKKFLDKSSTEYLIGGHLMGQPITLVLEKLKKKETDRYKKTYFTRMINAIERSDRNLTTKEFLEMPRALLLRRRNIGNKTLDAVFSALIRK